MQKIRITAISYLNTMPFVYGMMQSDYLKENSIIDFATPSECGDKLLSGDTDVGIVPVAILPRLGNYTIVAPFCIGAVGKVASVSLFSDVPLLKIKKIVLDYQSRTSVALVQILAEKYWKINPEFINGQPGFENKIGGETAGVVIGDRALLMQKRFKYNYDLSEEWLLYTGLPFVFALWVSTKKLLPEFTREFSKALKNGLSRIDEMVLSRKDIVFSTDEIVKYLKVNLSYDFNEAKKRGLELFLKYLSEQNL